MRIFSGANEVQERLLANRVEIGLVEGAVIYPELASRIWRQDELVLITSPTSPLVQETKLTLTSLWTSTKPFILREPGSGTRTVLEEAIALRGLTPIPPFYGTW